MSNLNCFFGKTHPLNSVDDLLKIKISKFVLILIIQIF